MSNLPLKNAQCNSMRCGTWWYCEKKLLLLTLLATLLSSPLLTLAQHSPGQGEIRYFADPENSYSIFDEKINKLVDFSSRSNTCVSVLMIDIDHFKKVNDTYGHQIGDHCLEHFAKLLKKLIRRETDLLARYGGEEFIITLSNCAEKDAKAVADKILKCLVNNPFVEESLQINLSCSLGLVSKVPITKFDSESLIKQADTALYKAKENGRSRVEVADQLNRLAS